MVAFVGRGVALGLAQAGGRDDVRAHFTGGMLEWAGAGEPVIKEITRVSKPGRRVYSKIKELPRVYAGLGVSILSTPRGVLSDAEARAANVGGEVLCRVF